MLASAAIRSMVAMLYGSPEREAAVPSRAWHCGGQETQLQRARRPRVRDGCAWVTAIPQGRCDGPELLRLSEDERREVMDRVTRTIETYLGEVTIAPTGHRDHDRDHPGA